MAVPLMSALPDEYSSPHSAQATTKPTAYKIQARYEKKQDDALHPAHFKHLGSHVAHLCKEVCKEADDLLVDPVHDLLQNRVGYKIPDKQAASPAFSF